MDTNQKEQATRQRRRTAAPASTAQRRSQAPNSAQRRQSANRRPAAKRPTAAARQKSAVPKRSDSLTDAPRRRNQKPGFSLAKLMGQVTGRDKRDQAARAAKLKAMRQEVAAKNDPKNRRRVSAPRVPGQPIVYTQPKTFNLHRLLIQLMSVLAVVLALILGMSVFFKVEVVEVAGANVYTEMAVWEASGIEIGDNLMTFSRPRATGKIYAALPYVDHVRFGIKLPNTVIIDIDELDVVYAIASSDGTWYLMSSHGKVVAQTDGGTAANYTKVKGVTLNDPIIGNQAVAYEEGSQFVEGEDGETQETQAELELMTVVTNAAKLSTGLTILQALERNGVVGEVASIDVTDLDHIWLYYGTRYDVNLGSSNDQEHNMDYKIAAMTAAIGELADYETGELDVSFSIWEDKVGYTPFA